MAGVDTESLVVEPRRRTLVQRNCLMYSVGVAVGVLIVVIAISVSLTYRRTDTNVYCKTSACVDMAHRMASSMDTSIDPCDDFYLHMCKKYTPNDNNYSSEIEIAIATINKQLIEALGSLDTSTMGPPAKLAQVFYQSCMDADLIEQLGTQPAIDVMDDFYSGFNVSDTGGSDNDSFTETLLMMGHSHGTFPLLLPAILVSENNAKEYAITMLPADYPLMQAIAASADLSRLYDAMLISTSEITSFVSTVVGIYGNDVNQTDVETSVNSITTVLLAHAKIMEKGSTDNVVSMKLSEFQAVLNTSKVNMVDYLNAVLPGDIGGDVTVFVPRTDYFTNLGKLLNTFSENDLNMYIKFMFNVDIMNGLPPYYVETYLQLVMDIYLAYLAISNEQAQPLTTSPQDPRATACLAVVAKYFPVPLGYLYVSDHDVVSNIDIITWKEIVSDIHTTYIERTATWTWMDDKTRAYANYKARNIVSTVAYPPYFDNITDVESRYHFVHMKADSYLMNMLTAKNFSLNDILFNNYGKPVKRSELPPMTYPQTFNAFYYPQTDGIYVLAGFMHPPAYYRNLPKFQLYGAAGYFVGHELTHAFDNDGRKYDAIGDRYNWWTPETDAEFVKKAVCYINQYSNMDLSPYTTERINGNLTLGEVIADSGGVHASWAAFQKWKLNNPEEAKERLPGINMNSDQLFFASLAQFYCRVVTADYVKTQLTDEHPPDPYRVLGVLQNSEAFAETFHCPVGSKYNPKDKCILY